MILNFKNINSFFIFFLLSIGFINSQTVTKDYIFVNKETVTKRAITSIIEDHKGFIWMGTNGAGLQKYNSFEYTSYLQQKNNPNSLSSSIVNCTYIDQSKRLWIGTESGLNLYNRKLDIFQQIALQKKSNQSIHVYAILETKNGDLLVGTHENGVFLINKTTFESKQVIFGNRTTFPDLLINQIVKDNNGKIYIASNLGLFYYNDAEMSMTLAAFDTKNGIDHVKNAIESLVIDKDGAIWIGTLASGLIKVSMGTNYYYNIEVFNITSKRILALLINDNQSIFCGTENDGLFHVNSNGKILKNYKYNKFDKNSIKSNSIWSLYKDSAGRIWVGFYNNGVEVYDQYYDKFNDIESLPNMPNSLQSKSVTSIAKDNLNRLWIGMDGGGLDIYNLNNKKFSHITDQISSAIKGLAGLDVQTVFIDSKFNVWIGTWNTGIYFLKKGSNQFINYNVSNTNGNITSNRILSFAEDKEGIIWIGSFLKGLHSYNLKTQEFKYYNSQSFVNHKIIYSNIRSVFVDSNNAVWLGTTRGLYKVIKDNKDRKVYAIEDLISSESEHEIKNLTSILSLYEDANNNLWIGTDGNGLFQFNLINKRVKNFGKDEGLKLGTVASIIQSKDGNLWLGGNKGLSKLEANYTFINYTVNDGLLSNDFNNNAVLEDENGILYFGNYAGINYFNPKEIITNPFEPSIYLSDFKLFNKSVSINDKNSPLKSVLSETSEITLTHQQSVFTISYAGINYTRSENNKYAYYLEGFEKDWNYVEDITAATYTNIGYGEYLFKVKAANNDGVWNKKPATLKITILPPWWISPLAIFSYILFILLVSYLAYKIINVRIQEKRLIKFERDKRLQEDELNDKKIQFFTNISHEFRTPLTLMLNPLEDIIKDKTLQLPDYVKEKHNIIYKNTTRLTRLINELMDFRKLQFNKLTVNACEIEAVAFINEVSSYFKEEAEQQDIKFFTKSNINFLTVWADPGMLEKILFNILSNAFKVTPEKGMITIEISIPEEKKILPLIDSENPISVIEICITDTGSGIKQKEIDQIFERFYQVKEMNSQYYGGTGIGLEVVQNFTNLHKGKIEVESTEDVGTTFHIFLAQGNSHFAPSEIFIPSKQNNNSKTTPINHNSKTTQEIKDEIIKKKTVMIVEDNVELRNYLSNELKNDYNIIVAINGLEALKLSDKKAPDVIISDVMMPKMDGYEFCKKLKENIKTSHIPVLMLSAKTMTDDWIKGIESGADIYMNKPFKTDILKTQLKRLINSRQILFDKYASGTNAFKTPTHTSSLDKEFIAKVLKYINKNLQDSQLGVESLAEELILSRSQLYRKIKALTGQTANEFIRKIRLLKAKELIENGYDSIGEIGFKVGFSSPSYFTKCFKSEFGVLPTELERPQNS
ncbi:hybrid sensor histidine kinase/response regulator transcription factor [uncultured Polaribacter sp.]|uniref:hybrid sensor histidine kinase/response regulator transcription factor n=1 Tax=uncultured Polaribacter sp. TaxID=174711 RepID=UPI00262AB4DA|nr:hybrid sensor histidine kinase/response regulator transcription factor [uncultured Polaribacter sp.]